MSICNVVEWEPIRDYVFNFKSVTSFVSGAIGVHNTILIPGANSAVVYTIWKTTTGPDDHFKVGGASGVITTAYNGIDRESYDTYVMVIRYSLLI